MKTVKQACVLADNALSIDVSDQIEQLEHLINAEGNGEKFYEKTFITAGMKELLRGTIERLAGKSSSAVFHLKQAMGGGKTHLIVGTGLAAKSLELRQKVCSDIPYIDGFKDARVVAFNGRNTPENYLWGEIAEQLGEAEKFKRFWVSGPEAPDEKAWLDVLKSDKPTLILLDEMPPYFHILGTKPLGTGTVADIATRAFSNMLSAAGKLSNVCVVVSDLDDASYAEGGKSISRALQDARKELGRQEKIITPVDLAGNEVYDILRKRLFKSLPDKAEIDDIAAKYGQALEEATKSKVLARGAEALADEISNTYPFHPRLKDLIALFKENERFKQTRGLMELMSRLLKSVWERDSYDVYLIGAQHFDLSIQEVRTKLADISGMSDVISKDVWNSDNSAHAQLIDAEKGTKVGSEVASLLLTASLSTAVNAVKGLNKAEILECVVTPLQGVSDYSSAFDELLNSCWYLHHNQDDQFYFDRQENLTKMLQSLAQEAPEGQVEALIKSELEKLFAAERKVAYSKVLAQPKLDDVVEEVKRSRVLLIIDPDSKLPPDELARFFASLTEKNNLLVLTGDKTQIANVQQAARRVFAVLKADSRIAKNHVQREEYENKAEQAKQDFVTTLLNVFDKVVYPTQTGASEPMLKHKPLKTERDPKKPFNGEEQIEQTLVEQPRKLYLDVMADFDVLANMAKSFLWNDNNASIDWSTVVAREKQRPRMPWLPPKGLEQLKTIAIQKGIWEDLGNGHVTHTPPKKKTSVQVMEDSVSNDEGLVRLRINAINAGPSARIHYQEEGAVSTSSAVLKEDVLETKALRVQFLAVDPNNQFETGDAVTWSNTLRVRSKMTAGEKRSIELFVAPRGDVKYTTDGSEPRNGTAYTGPFEISNDALTLLVFAEADGLEVKEKFSYPKVEEGGGAGGGSGPVEIPLVVKDDKPLTVKADCDFTSRTEAYRFVEALKEYKGTAQQVRLMVGQSPQIASLSVGEVDTNAEILELHMNSLSELLGASSSMVLKTKGMSFPTGQLFKAFADKAGLKFSNDEIEQ